MNASVRVAFLVLIAVLAAGWVKLRLHRAELEHAVKATP